jgi:hypothetical protein
MFSALMQGGKVKLLAVSTAKRASAAPDIPSVAEATEFRNSISLCGSDFLDRARCRWTSPKN